MEEEELAQLKLDLQLLLSFAPATHPDQVKDGLGGMFYVTGSFEGDLAIAKRMHAICDRYGIDARDIDDPELDELEVDFG